MEKETVLKESILNWYPFRPEAGLLEIGYSCKALTELFCRRVRSVTLVVFSEEEYIEAEEKLAGTGGGIKLFRNLADIEGQQFDYLVCVDKAESRLIASGREPEQTDPDSRGGTEAGIKTGSALYRWKEFLSPGGKILIGADNRYGLKYFCGAGEPGTGLPFLSVNNYPKEWVFDLQDGSRMYSRLEWKEILKEAGLSLHQFYYPVPDKTMPQMIFSDRYQDSRNALERLNDYDYEDPCMVGIEHRIFRDVIDGGALPFMANSFLIEAAVDGKLTDIDFAVVTTDRGEERGMATMIVGESDGETARQKDCPPVHLVVKRPLWKKGEGQIRLLHAYTQELSQKGVPVVPTELGQDEAGLFLSMPYVREKGLTSVLDELCSSDPELFLQIFDEIYRYICMSFTPGENGTGRVFIDLAPCNCFYLPEEKEAGRRLLFYDQEFVCPDGTPAYAMYRTIKYYFASSLKARQAMSAADLYARYAITEEQIPSLEEKEAAFLESVKNTGEFSWVIRSSTPDYAVMQKRAERLIPDPEKPYRKGYVPGVFDLFHTGHLRLIERCKARCEYLVVGVLTDELVEFYKGKRPVISCEDRMNVIRGLRDVDEVIPVDFSNTDKLDAWEQLHYDCHFSGDDHVNHWNDVWEELKKRGSNMEFFSYTKGISSTEIKESMK